MVKFSIIIPIYGVENYLNNCLTSIKKQTFSNFEVIMVDDGSRDNSSLIMEQFSKEDNRFLSFHKENGGQSSARNFGVTKATGDYLIFVDGDDEIAADLLNKCDQAISENVVDIVRYQMTKKTITTSESRVLRNKPFAPVTGIEAFQKFIEDDELFDSPCLYAFKTEFYRENHFTFTEGKIHEDFGLIPYIIIKAREVVSISYPGYIYIERSGSVMTEQNEQHLLRRMNDMFFHYDQLYLKVKNDETIDDNFKKIFYSFLANAILGIADIIPRRYLKEYKAELKKRHVTDNLRTDSIMRQFKKMCAKYFLSYYITVFIRKGR